VSFFHRGRVRRTRKGMYRLDVPDNEREILRRLLPQLRTVLADEDPADERARRLFPPAYTDDDAADAEYQRLMREDLVSSHLAALDLVEASLDANELTEGQLVAWMSAVNSVRLVLGTLLDVDEELDIGRLPNATPDIESYALYAYLSNLLGDMVEALNP
jgi:Domain of unknown function (DUF2017)